MNLTKLTAFSIGLTIISLSTSAAEWTSRASPYSITYSQESVVLRVTSWGDPLSCGNSGDFAILKSHPQYDDIKGQLEGSFMDGPDILAYVTECANVTTPEGTLKSVNLISGIEFRK